MIKTKLPYLVLVAALIASVIQAVVFGKQLPETVASHFGGQGVANGWMSRGAFIAMSLIIQFGTALFMAGLGKMLRMLPASMINIPNRDYWLADERRVATLQHNQFVLVWVTAATSVFLLFVFQSVIDANLNPGNGLNMLTFGVALGIYLVIVFALTICMTMKFSRIPRDTRATAE